jgi:DNA-directed RNA polymerase III subunit RPC3
LIHTCLPEHRHVDLAKANAVILSILIKTVANIFERKVAESERPLVKALLETRERMHVAEDRDLLTVAEKRILQQWEDKMVKLTVLEARLDEAIFILRELPLES